MSGITSIGAYIPQYRLPRKAFSEAWGSGGGLGERSVANHDEDTLTMAVNAAVDALGANGRDQIDAVHFASTTAPYREKQSATVVATAADLGTDIRAVDFAGSLRAGTSALLAAFDAVNAGSASNVLVVAADDRWGYPKSDHESTFGDAAAAVVVSKGAAAVEVVAQASIANEITDVWRRASDDFVRTWEDRFVIQHGYDSTTKQAIRAVLDKAGLQPADITKAVVYGPETRSHQALIRGAGFDPGAQAQDNLIATVGNTGAAHALLMLVAALEEAKAGDKILLASYGEGADALVLEVKKKPKKGRAVSGHLAIKRTLPSYERYLAYRGIVGVTPEAPLRVEPYAASTVAWRTRSQTLRFHGSKCNQCGTLHHPIQRICYNCQSKDDYTEVRLYDKPGTVFTFTRDNLAGGLEPPTVNCVVESDEGNARISCIMTDNEPLEGKVGARVEFTFRKIHEAGNYHNYYWKCRPIRSA